MRRTIAVVAGSIAMWFSQPAGAQTVNYEFVDESASPGSGYPARVWLIGTVVTTLALFNGVAIGQTINLACSGTVSDYETHTGSSVTGAATIDLEQGHIKSPVGDFHIIRFDETQIFFDDPGGKLVVSGHLDRTTGGYDMKVDWRRPEEEAKLQAGQPADDIRAANLSCAASK
jgi:hypothetical protein